MQIKKIVELLEAEILWGEELLENEVHSACAADMMSDVLAFVKDQAVLISGLANPQVVRTAEMMDMRCIVMVRGKRPDNVFIELAKSKNIVVLTSKARMYSACGLLYANGLGAGEHNVD